MTHQRILAGVSRDDFIGRDAELKRVVRQASHDWGRPGLLLLAAPSAGAGELLRQSFDELFSRRADAIPIHLAFERSQGLIETARNCFQGSVQQYIAYRRVDARLCKASLTLHDLAELAFRFALRFRVERTEGAVDAEEHEVDELTRRCGVLPGRGLRLGCGDGHGSRFYQRV